MIRNIFLLCCLFVFSSSINCQKTLFEYKKMTDKEVKKQLNKPVYKLLRFNGYFGQSIPRGDSFLAGEIVNKNMKQKIKVSLLSFLYFINSAELNHKFHFRMSIDSNLTIYKDSGGYQNIPECVRLGYKCNFISKYHAIELAQKDSIKHPDNLLVEFEGSKSGDYYWVISGQDKDHVDYSIVTDDGWPFYPKRKNNTRIFNAKTGSPLNFEDYEKIHR